MVVVKIGNRVLTRREKKIVEDALESYMDNGVKYGETMSFEELVEIWVLLDYLEGK